MKKTIATILVFSLTAYLSYLGGCTRQKTPGVDAKTDMAIIKLAFKEADRALEPDIRIKYLRTAYQMASELEENWPDNTKVPVFLEEYEAELNRIPQQIFELSLDATDLESFKWAVAHADDLDLEPADLRWAWEMEKEWRDFLISKYPDNALPVFMYEAAKDLDTNFFNKHIGAFKATGYRLVDPLDENEFMAHLTVFMAKMFDTAVENGDAERVAFLLEYMPKFDPRIHMDPIIIRAMHRLSDYIFHELKDEAMACKLVTLRYDMAPIDLEKSGFGNDFAKTLLSDLDYAVRHVLKLDDWHGPLSEKEMNFMRRLPEPLLRSVHKRYMLEAMEIALKNQDIDYLERLIQIRQELNPFTIREYDRLLGWSIKYQNRKVYDYVMKRLPDVDVYNVSLVELGKTPNLFRMHASRIFRDIEPTMDKQPRRRGTTLGRIDDLLRSHNPEAVLYVVKKYDIDKVWRRVPMKGRTLLMAVCEGGNVEAAEYLIERKNADIQARTDFTKAELTLLGRARATEGGFRAIHFAAKGGHGKMIEFLKSRGANINAKSILGTTPLMVAASAENLEAAKTLIALGADVNAQMDVNLRGADLAESGGIEALRTAYRRAMSNGNMQMIELLRKNGAVP